MCLSNLKDFPTNNNIGYKVYRTRAYSDNYFSPILHTSKPYTKNKWYASTSREVKTMNGKSHKSGFFIFKTLASATEYTKRFCFGITIVCKVEYKEIRAKGIQKFYNWDVNGKRQHRSANCIVAHKIKILEEVK